MAKIVKYTVLILPIIFIWAGLNFHKAKYANDPEYIYLVNAVAICNGKSVGHIDNPGTTVMQIGAATIAVKHLFSNPGNDSVVNHVFKEPNQFVDAIRFVFLLLNTLVLFFLGWLSIKKTGSVWAALLLQATTFISANTLDHVWTKMSPEPVLFFVTCLFVIAIFYFYAAKDKNSWKWIIIFALLTGAGLGTKATFLPLVLFPFVLFPTLKNKFLYLVAVIPSFILFTIPAIPEYERMYFWFRNLISHSGKYGHGEKELLNLETYIPNLQKIIQNNLIFGVITGISVLVVLISLPSIFKKSKEINWNIRILAGLTASSVFGILLVAKQYNANHYLIPVLLLTGISLFFILTIVFNSGILLKAKKIIFPLVLISLLVFLSWKQPPEMQYANNGYKITNEEMDSTSAMLERDYVDYTKINYYPFTLNKYSALNFGDVYTNRKLLPALKNLYPNTYFYDFYFNLMQYWNAEIFLEDVIEFNGNKILVVGGPRDENLLPELEKRGIPLKTIYKGRIQAIYELDTLTYQQITSNKIRTIEKEISCDAENVSADNQFFIASDGKTAGNQFPRSNETSRSGKYSIKMDDKTEYALEYKLDSIKQGEKYEVEVWRKSDNNSGRLVINARDAKIFYKAQNDFITSDKNGWDLLRIKFEVSPEMENETLKIYLWNKEKKLGYFDDLTIKKIVYKTPETNHLIAKSK